MKIISTGGKNLTKIKRKDGPVKFRAILFGAEQFFCDQIQIDAKLVKKKKIDKSISFFLLIYFQKKFLKKNID